MTQIELHIHSLGPHGEGISSYADKVVFVPGALPEERVLVKIIQEEKKYLKANLIRVLEPSPQRRQAPCPVFEQCGACQVMHLKYEEQVKLKTQIVHNALASYLKKAPCCTLFPCVPSPKELGYRQKMQVIAFDENGKCSIGLYAARSQDFVAIKNCPVASDSANKILEWIQNTPKISDLRYIAIRSSHDNQESLVTFVTKSASQDKLLHLAKKLCEEVDAVTGVFHNHNDSQSNRIFDSIFTHLCGKSHIKERINNSYFELSPVSFFQINPDQAENMYNQALELADLKESDLFVDAYCGVGVMAILAAQIVKKSIGIEVVPEAIEDAQKNAQLNSLINCQFVCSSVEDMVESLEKNAVFLLNPPRKGCDRSVLQNVAKLKPKRIVYISCNPKSLARDLNLLMDLGYVSEEIHPFDLFPQTMHVETVVLLKCP